MFPVCLHPSCPSFKVVQRPGSFTTSLGLLLSFLVYFLFTFPDRSEVSPRTTSDSQYPEWTTTPTRESRSHPTMTSTTLPSPPTGRHGRHPVALTVTFTPLTCRVLEYDGYFVDWAVHPSDLSRGSRRHLNVSEDLFREGERPKDKRGDVLHSVYKSSSP